MGGLQRRLFGKVKQSARRLPNRQRRLSALEPLEPRQLLATRMWTGGAMNNSNWNDAANWDVLPVANDDLVFPAGQNRMTNTNDFANGLQFASITIREAGYTLGGNPVALTGDLTADFATGTSNYNIATTLSASDVSVSGGATLAVGGALTTAQAFTLDKTGAGTLVLSTDNSDLAGPINVGAGTLQASNPGALGATTEGTTVAAGATLELAGVAIGAEGVTLSGAATLAGTDTSSLDGDVSLSGSATISAPTTSDVLTLSGSIISAAANTLTASGLGALRLAADNNSLAGPISITAGTLQASNPGALGATTEGTTVAAGATLELAGVAIGAEGVTLSGAATLASTGNSSLAGGVTLTGTGAKTVRTPAVADALTLSGVITGANDLTKTGAGTATFAGANDYSGLTTVSAGTLLVSNNTGLGTVAVGTAVANEATLALSGGIAIGAEALSIRGDGAANDGALRNVSGANIFGGPITLLADTTIGGPAGTLALTNAIGGAFALTKIGAHTLRFEGSADNTYGDTTVSGGVLILAKDPNVDAIPTGLLTINGGATVQHANLSTNQIANGGTVVVTGAGSTLDLNGQNETIGAATVSGATILAGTATLTLAGTPTALTMTGGRVESTGAGTIALAGNVVTNNSAATATIAGAVSLGGMGSARTFTIADDLTNPDPDLAISATIAGALGLIKDGPGTLSLEGAANNTYTGATTVNDGTLALFKDAAIAIAGSPLTINTGATVRLDGADQIANDVDVAVVGGTFNLNALAETIQDLTMTAGSVMAGTLTLLGDLTTLASGTSATISSNLVLPAVATITVAGGMANPDLIVTGVVGGAATTLTKGGPGDLRFEGMNNYAGLTEVTAGSLIAADALALGMTVDGTNVATGATLTIDNAAIGAEAVTLSGAATLAGVGLSSLAGGVTLTGAATIGIALEADQLTLSGAISGAGSLTKTGAGTLIYNGTDANTYAGGTTVDEGTLELSKNAMVNAIAGSPLTINTGATVRLDAADQIDNNVNVDVIGGAFNLNALAETIQDLTMTAGTVTAGTLTLLGDLTSLASGTTALITANLVLPAAAAVTVAEGGANPDLNVTGVVSGAATSLTKAGLGELRFAGANAYDGRTDVTAGTLIAVNALALGTTAGGTSVALGATLTINGVAIGAEDVSLTGTGDNGVGSLTGVGTASLAGTVSLTGATTIGVAIGADSLTLSGAISGAQTLTKIGAGTLIFSADNVNFAGAILINDGLLRAEAPSALGDTTSGTTVADGATLAIAGVAIGAEGVSLTGSGDGGVGALSATGPASLAGPVTLIGPAVAIGVTSDAATLSGVIAGPSTLTKIGAGTLVLTNINNAYTGATTVAVGTLLVDGGIAASSGVMVNNLATLGGSGTVSGITAAAGATVAPGGTPGRLTSTSATFATGAVFVVEINGPLPGTGYDQLVASDSFDLGPGPANGATLVLIVDAGYSSMLGRELLIIDGGMRSGIFFGLPDRTLIEANSRYFVIEYTVEDVILRDVTDVIVTTTLDDPNDPDLPSLRNAIIAANGGSARPGEPDEIRFRIPVMDPALYTIQVTGSALPAITETVFVNGQSQPGFLDSPIIQLDGQLAGASANGLEVMGAAASNTTISGFIINGFSGNGIALNSVSGVLILGNYIGTDADGLAAVPNGGSGVLTNQSFANTIGGVGPNQLNLISGNLGHGVQIIAGSSLNVLLGNLIGTDLSGAAVLGNTLAGVLIDNSADNSVGTAAAGNTIGGNVGGGVSILGPAATRNQVLRNTITANGNSTTGIGAGVAIDGAPGNLIGGGADGNTISANLVEGVGLFNTGASGNIVAGNLIEDNQRQGVAIVGAPNNTVGGAAGGNTISGNLLGGVLISGIGAAGNVVSANTITANGNTPLAAGVAIVGAPDNLLGGALANTITGSAGAGVTIFDAGASGNTVSGNTISTNAAQGVLIDGATQNLIGGTNPNTITSNQDDGVQVLQADGNTIDANVIAENAGNGIAVLESTSTLVTGNTITGNDFSGVEITNASTSTLVQGNTIILNDRDGVRIGGGASGVTIGAAPGDDVTPNTLTTLGNLISSNSLSGVSATGSGLSNVFLRGNYIGSDLSGTIAAGNGGAGILVAGANNLTISANLISGNAGSGVRIEEEATGNRLIGNFIGADSSGTGRLGNTLSGVVIDGASANTVGGASGPFNVISNNGLQGVLIIAPADGVATANVVDRNFIGTDAGGTLDRGNAMEGILILGNTDATVAGNLITGNVVSWNNRDGVAIFGVGASDNVVAGNFIGTDLSGTLAQANAMNGVLLTSGAASNTVGTNNTIANHAQSGVAVVDSDDNSIGGNTIRSNAQNGVLIQDSSGNTASGNTITGSAAGVSVGGSTSTRVDSNTINNNGDGVVIDGSAGTNVVGDNDISFNFGDGVVVTGGSSQTTIAGNLIESNDDNGALVTGASTDTILTGNDILSNRLSGVRVEGLANGVAIGGSPGPFDGSLDDNDNWISDNGGDGVSIVSAAAGTVFVRGNFIGTDPSGITALPNARGVVIDGVAGVTVDANLISGNTGDGVVITGAGAAGNQIIGNFIGTDATGTLALGNGQSGVLIDMSAAANTIGGTTEQQRNVLSGNAAFGVAFSGGASANVVAGNFIGADAGGTIALGNSLSGLMINGASDNTIGGATPDRRNVFSANGADGVTITAPESGLSLGNLVQGNFIGTDASGTLDLGNGGDGVSVLGAPDAAVGRNTIEGNTVVGNGLNGIAIRNIGASANLVAGNFIGTDASGTLVLGNTTNGVLIKDGAAANVIGGANVIANNSMSGVVVLNAVDNRLIDNVIRSNQDQGIFVQNSTGSMIEENSIANNTLSGVAVIGSGDTFVDGNLIADNGLHGVLVQESTSTDVSGNSISANQSSGVTVLNTAPESSNDVTNNTIIANGQHGVLVQDSRDVVVSDNSVSDNTLSGLALVGSGGTLARGNQIFGNAAHGVLVTGASTDTTVIGNLIDSNGGEGVRVDGLADGVTIGGSTALFDAILGPDGNLISGNAGDGVAILSAVAGSVVVRGNFIGTDRDGATAQPNARGVVIDNVAGVLVDANLVSGNTGDGVVIAGAGATGNAVAGNFIGTDATGRLALGNRQSGVLIDDLATANTIGGDTAAARNVISGNDDFGVAFSGRASDNVVVGSFIGTDASGTIALGNSSSGVGINGASNNTIGGTTPELRNVISGNAQNGVFITAEGGVASGNLVAGNSIGTDAAGTLALGNALNGVLIEVGTSSNTVGGGNLIANNGTSGTPNLAGVAVIDATGNSIGGNTIQSSRNHGVLASRSTDTTIIGNTITASTLSGVAVLSSTGTLLQGNQITANIEHGVLIESATTTTLVGNTIADNMMDGVRIDQSSNGVRIGGEAGAFNNTLGANGNLISGNAGDGVAILSAVAGSVVVRGNFIGTDRDGASADPNTRGIFISGVAGVTVDINLLSGNTAAGVSIGGPGATGNRLIGNQIGTDATGTTALANSIGVVVADGATANIIGGADAATRNLISGNTAAGVSITGAAASANIIAGNFIGTDAAGTAALANSIGVVFADGATANLIGGLDDGAGNLISGNAANGVELLASGNSILGNRIGTDASGTLAVPNQASGVLIRSAANTIGGLETAASNVIAGNTAAGVSLTGAAASANSILGNLIGTDAAGTAALANGAGVVTSIGATANLIGGLDDGAGNLISGNAANGVELLAGGNTVLGNRIGTDLAGTLAVANQANGILIRSAANTIGGPDPGARNLISGNRADGLAISGAHRNVVLGNFIGLQIDGQTSLANQSAGVALLVGAQRNTIGGTGDGMRNVISGNTAFGVEISSIGTSGNVIAGNFIGTDVTGTLARGNRLDGVVISEAATQNTIGGTTTNAGNLISGNGGDGVEITGQGTTGNLVAGNSIGTAATATTALGNASAGVRINGGAVANTVGGAVNARNLISGNQDGGVALADLGTSGNLVAGNFIGTDETGTQAVGNGGRGGVVLSNGASSNTIGGRVAAGSGMNPRNVIAGNQDNGVAILDAGTSSNVVAGNFIGTDLTGSNALGNLTSGVFIDNASDNTIGGVGLGNLIAGNHALGVIIANDQAARNLLQGNTIGGAAGLGNTATGIAILNAPDNTIGGASEAERNIIIANGSDGIGLFEAGATRNRIIGNRIGTDASGTIALGNQGSGILILRAVGNTIGGADDEANLIAGHAGGYGVAIDSGSQNLIQRNQIGTDSTGTMALANALSGVFLLNAPNNPVVLNLISGNEGAGIEIRGTGASGNTISRNLIGTDASGASPLGNRFDGIQILDASNNTIEANTSSGNTLNGLLIQGAAASANLVISNVFGTDTGGTIDVGNLGSGVVIDGAPNNAIGRAGAGNTLSGNAGFGLAIVNVDATGNLVQGNRIGTDASGTVALSNDLHGVLVLNAPDNTIGAQADVPAGVLDPSGNLVSGNQLNGVLVQSSADVRISGNFVGTNLAGDARLPNALIVPAPGSLETFAGVFLLDSPDGAVQGNLLSGNGLIAAPANSNRNAPATGLTLQGSGTTRTTAAGNLIGTDATGSRPLGNDFHGVYINQAPGNTISGSTISGNGTEFIPGQSRPTDDNSGIGVFIFGANASANVLQGNRIGVDQTGGANVTNSYVGVLITDAPNNTVGGADFRDAATRNVISGNAAGGVTIYQNPFPEFPGGDGLATGNVVSGNIIGLEATGINRPETSLGSQNRPYVQNNGVYILGASNNTIRDNVISGNGDLNDVPANDPLVGRRGSGILIAANTDPAIVPDAIVPNANVVQGNFIGTTQSGLPGAPTTPAVQERLKVRTVTANLADGILLIGASATTIGGAQPAQSNVIASNGGNGLNVTTAEFTSGGTRTFIPSRTMVLRGNGIGIALRNPATPGQVASLSPNQPAGNLFYGVHRDFRSRASGPISQSTNIIRHNRFGQVRTDAKVFDGPGASSITGQSAATAFPAAVTRRSRGIDGRARPFTAFRP